MKILKQLIIGFALISVCDTTKAEVPVKGNSSHAVRVKENNSTLNHAINIYIEVTTRNRVHEMGNMVDASAKFTLLSQRGILSYSKDEMMDYIKTIKNVEFNCTTSTTIVQNNDDIALAKIDMQFPSFLRTDYVNFANTKTGWKITNSYSVFK